MKQRLCEAAKLDAAILPQALNNTSTTSPFFSMQYSSALLFLLSTGQIPAGKTVSMELLQASDSAGSDSKTIPDSLVEIDDNSGFSSLQIDLTNTQATDVITINGVAFVMGGTTNLANKIFADAAGLKDNIELWLPEFGVTVQGNLATVISFEPGDEIIVVSKTENAGTIVFTPLSAIAFVEANTGVMDKKNGFTHVAARVTTDDNIFISASVIRGDNRYSAEQKVADYQILPNL